MTRRTIPSLAIALALLVPAAGAADDDPRSDLYALRAVLGSGLLSDKDLVPRGFVKTAEGRGDLDGDGIDDVVITVHRDLGGIKGPTAPDAPDILVQPVLVFRGDRSGRYTLWKAGGTHYPEWLLPSPGEEEDPPSLKITKRVLSVEWPMRFGSGSWTTQGCTAKWRFGSAGFQLIGFKVTQVDRSCACVSSTDTNYLTGVQVFSTNNDGNRHQLKKDRVVKTRQKRPALQWEQFEWEELCRL